MFIVSFLFYLNNKTDITQNIKTRIKGKGKQVLNIYYLFLVLFVLFSLFDWMILTNNDLSAGWHNRVVFWAVCNNPKWRNVDVTLFISLIFTCQNIICRQSQRSVHSDVALMSSLPFSSLSLSVTDSVLECIRQIRFWTMSYHLHIKNYVEFHGSINIAQKISFISIRINHIMPTIDLKLRTEK